MHGLLDKRILIVGLGKTGYAVLRFLQRHQLPFEVLDTGLSADAVALFRQHYGDVVLHQSFEAAEVSGFDVLIVSPGVPLADSHLVAAAAAGIEIIGDVELFARCCDKPIIAVTGSNGKSTVVSWLAAALEGSELTGIACGNIGMPVLDALLQPADVYLIELSSYQLEATESLQPLAACVLNVSDDHLDRYDSFAHYAETKRRIYRQASRCVINLADAETWPDELNEQQQQVGFVASTAAKAPAANAPVASRFSVTSIDDDLWLQIDAEPLCPVAALPLPGQHNIENALAALALLEPLQLPWAQLLEGMQRFRGLPHRTELVATHQGVRWYNDSKGTNVDATRKAITAMQVPVILIAGGISKDADMQQLRDVIAAHVKRLILIGRDAEVLEQALGDLTPVEHADSMQAAVRLAADCAANGDAVLLSPACSSFDMFRNFEHRGEEFTREVQEIAA